MLPCREELLDAALAKGSSLAAGSGEQYCWSQVGWPSLPLFRLKFPFCCQISRIGRLMTLMILWKKKRGHSSNQDMRVGTVTKMILILANPYKILIIRRGFLRVEQGFIFSYHRTNNFLGGWIELHYVVWVVSENVNSKQFIWWISIIVVIETFKDKFLLFFTVEDDFMVFLKLIGWWLTEHLMYGGC